MRLSFRWLVTAPGLAFAVLMMAEMGWEALNLGLLAAQATVDDYDFGGDVMIAHGGRHFSSRTAYVGTAAVVVRARHLFHRARRSRLEGVAAGRLHRSRRRFERRRFLLLLWC
jgi:hypothetical protein